MLLWRRWLLTWLARVSNVIVESQPLKGEVENLVCFVLDSCLVVCDGMSGVM